MVVWGQGPGRFPGNEESSNDLATPLHAAPIFTLPVEGNTWGQEFNVMTILWMLSGLRKPVFSIIVGWAVSSMALP